MFYTMEANTYVDLLNLSSPHMLGYKVDVHCLAQSSTL